RWFGNARLSDAMSERQHALVAYSRGTGLRAGPVVVPHPHHPATPPPSPRHRYAPRSPPPTNKRADGRETDRPSATARDRSAANRNHHYRSAARSSDRAQRSRWGRLTSAAAPLGPAPRALICAKRPLARDQAPDRAAMAALVLVRGSGPARW